MPKAIPTITLTEAEQVELQGIVSQGTHAARTVRRAQILLHSHGGKSVQAIASWLGSSLGLVYNVRRRYLGEGLAGALYEKPRSGQPLKLNLRQEAAITVLACSDAPPGHVRWTIRLLADHVVKAEIVDGIAPETIRRFLKKTNLSLG